MVVGTLLIGAVGLVIFATPLLGNRALIVRSGSMVPAIAVGDVVVVRPQSGPYYAGQVIAFKEQNGKVVTHRVVAVSQAGYQTKGDANAEADGWAVYDGDIIGRELFVVPWVGKALALAKTKIGFVLLVVLPTLLVILSEVRIVIKELRRRGETVPPVTKVLVVLAAASMIMTHSSWALFSDSGTSTNNVLAAAASFGTDHPVISEVQIKGSTANQDFVELYNPTSSRVTLDGWKLRLKNSAGTESSLVAIGAGKSIPAHGFFLWANTAGGFDTSIGADVSNGNNLSDNNSVALRKPDDTTVDQVAWGATSNPQFVEGTAFTPSPASNQSIERKALSTSTAATMTGVDATKGNGFDADNNLTDFVLRTTSQPQNSGSPTETP